MALNVAIQQYRGTRANLAALASTGKAGVLAWTTDTNEVFVDSGSGTGIGAGNAWLKVAHDLVSVNAQTGASYTIVTGDRGKLLTLSNAGAVAVTLPQATAQSGNFPVGWALFVTNLGAGTVTITPTTSTIDGAASLTLTTNEGVLIVSDGTNYFTMRGRTSIPASGPVANQWVSQINADGTANLTQPAFSNISGTLAQTQLPTTITAGSNLSSIDCGSF